MSRSTRQSELPASAVARHHNRLTGILHSHCLTSISPNPLSSMPGECLVRPTVRLHPDARVLERLPRMTALTIDQIREAIPHREPFLWIDEVTEVTEKRIVAKKELTPDLDVFRGHYPHFPVFPGVLQCEACFQAGAILVSRLQSVGEGKVPVVTRVNNVKFRHLLRPGDILMIEVELTEVLQNTYFMTGKVSANGQVASRLEFACTAATME